jgi:transcriptional regulator with XRE-family HTH domain
MFALMPALHSDPNLRVAVGGRIKSLRKARGWTMKELAAQLSVRHTHLSKYESGLHAPPLEKLAQLAEIFAVTFDYLVAGRQPNDQPVTSLHLLERFRALEAVPADDQHIVVSVIDAMIAKNRMASALKPVAPRNAG